jgi:hypothetical protein
MTKAEATACGIEERDRRQYFRVDSSGNMAPPEHAVWRRIISVNMKNATAEYPIGDFVGVVTPWKKPGTLDAVAEHDIRAIQDRIATGTWAEYVTAANWAGHAIGEALGINSKDKGVGKAKCQGILDALLASKALTTERIEVKGKNRTQSIVIVGVRND